MSAEDLLRHIGANIYWEPLLSSVPAPLHYGPFPLSDPHPAQNIAYIITQSAETGQLLNIS